MVLQKRFSPYILSFLGRKETFKEICSKKEDYNSYRFKIVTLKLKIIIHLILFFRKSVQEKAAQRKAAEEAKAVRHVYQNN